MIYLDVAVYSKVDSKVNFPTYLKHVQTGSLTPVYFSLLIGWIYDHKMFDASPNINNIPYCYPLACRNMCYLIVLL